MIPRGKLDIGWLDLVAGALRCAAPARADARQARLERFWDAKGHGVATLSVRSGLDLLLSVLRLPAGSEVLVSAVTIRDMVTILEAHGLVPVPVDLDMERLEVAVDEAAARITPRTRAILVAHLFGSRMPLDEIADLARRSNLLLLEDCAQAWDGPGYFGHPGADVSFFSFGPIKTNTALGGALLRFRKADLAERVRVRQRALPMQTRRAFLGRTLKYTGIKFLLLRPCYTLFVLACRRGGLSHDKVISRAVRGFAGGELLPGIRRRPSYPLLALMERRLRSFDEKNLRDRAETGRRALAAAPHLACPGRHASHHTHWVVPVFVADPDAVSARLQSLGLDATRGASNLRSVAAPEGSGHPAPERARAAMARILYLPVYRGMGARDLRRLGEALCDGGAPSPEFVRPSAQVAP